ncbi:MAG: P1 family peptidase [Cyanobacteria bacterium HKST-UBA02]|nr:P1 family peptidase [Cyanobacteria bacterium HKST-UBA02]
MGINSPGSTREKRMRLRDLGVEIGIYPTGTFNAITDVEGVLVGHVTLRSGKGKLVAGNGPARTGVTAIIPHGGDIFRDRPSAGAFVLNGNGEFTGLSWLAESGCLEGPILLTNTLSVPRVADGAITWMLARYPELGITEDTYLPVVGECDDSALNDIRGRHVKAHHAVKALDRASSGPVAEGAVGAGTGMISFRFKAGIGTSSRVLPVENGGYSVGVLVNSNFGSRHQLRIDGINVGREITDLPVSEFRDGSICIVVATDAPLSSLELERLSRRAAMGLARTGATAQNGSGDFVVAFSTTRLVRRKPDNPVLMLPELDIEQIDPLFEAVADATEEAVLNSLLSAKTTIGRDSNIAHALPIGRCLSILNRHGKGISNQRNRTE